MDTTSLQLQTLELQTTSTELQMTSTFAIIVFGTIQFLAVLWIIWREWQASKGQGTYHTETLQSQERLHTETLQSQEKRHADLMQWWKEQHEEHKERHEETMRGFEQQEHESVRRHEEVMAELYHAARSDSGEDSAERRARVRGVVTTFTVPKGEDR